MFALWDLYLSEVMISSFDLVMRLACCSFNFETMASGRKETEGGRGKRRMTLVLTLLTFWPPGPDDLAKESE